MVFFLINFPFEHFKALSSPFPVSIITLRLLGGFSDLLKALLSVNDSPCDIYKTVFLLGGVIKKSRAEKVSLGGMNWVISDFAALLGGSRWGKEETGTEQESSNHGFIPCLGSTFLPAVKAVTSPLPGCHVQSLQGFRHLNTFPMYAEYLENICPYT